MNNGDITPEISRFIRDNINSVEQLEVLLLLADASSQRWNAQQVATKLYRDSQSVADRLESLRSLGLVQVENAPGGENVQQYCYNASNREHLIVRGLASAYQVRKDAVIGLIFSRPPDHLRAFSDAFRLRKED